MWQHFISTPNTHSLSCQEGITYSQALPYNMIISEDHILLEALNNLMHILLAHIYPLHLTYIHYISRTSITSHVYPLHPTYIHHISSHIYPLHLIIKSIKKPSCTLTVICYLNGRHTQNQIFFISNTLTWEIPFQTWENHLQTPSIRTCIHENLHTIANEATI